MREVNGLRWASDPKGKSLILSSLFHGVLLLLLARYAPEPPFQTYIVELSPPSEAQTAQAEPPQLPPSFLPPPPLEQNTQRNRPTLQERSAPQQAGSTTEAASRASRLPDARTPVESRPKNASSAQGSDGSTFGPPAPPEPSLNPQERVPSPPPPSSPTQAEGVGPYQPEGTNLGTNLGELTADPSFPKRLSQEGSSSPKGEVLDRSILPSPGSEPLGRQGPPYKEGESKGGDPLPGALRSGAPPSLEEGEALSTSRAYPLGADGENFPQGGAALPHRAQGTLPSSPVTEPGIPSKGASSPPTGEGMGTNPSSGLPKGEVGRESLIPGRRLGSSGESGRCAIVVDASAFRLDPNPNPTILSSSGRQVWPPLTRVQGVPTEVVDRSGIALFFLKSRFNPEGYDRLLQFRAVGTKPRTAQSRFHDLVVLSEGDAGRLEEAVLSGTPCQMIFLYGP